MGEFRLREMRNSTGRGTTSHPERKELLFESSMWYSEQERQPQSGNVDKRTVDLGRDSSGCYLFQALLANHLVGNSDH